MEHSFSSFIKNNPGSPVALLTGATGGLGAALLPRLLDRRPDTLVVMVVRASDEDKLRERAAQLCQFAGVEDAARHRLMALKGDVTLPQLGLSDEDHELLVRSCTDIFHMAADLRFELSIEESRILNVDSTRHVLALSKLARQHRLQRLNYVSTAYISGTRTGVLQEDELDVGQSYFNAYEQSKMEAEQLVRQSMDQLPATIYRPSMIIGESGTGKIRNFFGCYEFLKLVNKGKVSAFPAKGDIRPDLVPIDYVADGLLFLAGYPQAQGRTFHLAAGPARSLTIEQILSQVAGTFFADQPQKIPQIVDPQELESRLSERALKAFKNSALNILLRTYMPYVAFEREFDVDETAALLEQHGIRMTPLDEVLPVACRFALDHNFGESLH